MEWCSPVGASDLQMYPPPGWTITNWLGALYTLHTLHGDVPTYHTGDDINMPGMSEVGQPIRAIHAGVVTFSGDGGGSWCGMVVVRHDFVEGFVYARYAHIDWKTLHFKAGDAVNVGDPLGYFINPVRAGRANFEAHCHFDIGTTNDATLLRDPKNWPKKDLAFIRTHYQSPSKFLRPKLSPVRYAGWQVTLTALNVRKAPTTSAVKLTVLPEGTPIQVDSGKIVKANNEAWAKVTDCPNKLAIGGWVATRYLSEKG